MKGQINTRIFPFIFLFLLCSGCTGVGNPHTEEALPDLKNLTRLVEAAVVYEGASLKNGDRALLEIASINEPSHLENLDRFYHIRPAIIKGHAIILLCTKDKKTALFETQACSDQKPKRYYDVYPPLPCAFTYTAEDVGSLCD